MQEGLHTRTHIYLDTPPPPVQQAWPKIGMPQCAHATTHGSPGVRMVCLWCWLYMCVCLWCSVYIFLNLTHFFGVCMVCMVCWWCSVYIWVCLRCSDTFPEFLCINVYICVYTYFQRVWSTAPRTADLLTNSRFNKSRHIEPLKKKQKKGEL